MDSLVSASLTAAIGSRGPLRATVVEPGAVVMFREAVAVADGLLPGLVPTSFLVRVNFRVAARIAYELEFDAATLNAGTRYEVVRPLAVGDVVIVESGVLSATQKQGQQGPLLFVETGYWYRTGNGAELGRAVQTTVHRPRPPAAERGMSGSQGWAAPRGEAIGPIDKHRLVQWAAASGDFNPLHYDAPYARAQGQPGVVVTGSLKLAIAEAVATRRFGHGLPLRRIDVRHSGTDFTDEPLGLEVGEAGTAGEYALRLFGPRGISMTGVAVPFDSRDA